MSVIDKALGKVKALTEGRATKAAGVAREALGFDLPSPERLTTRSRAITVNEPQRIAFPYIYDDPHILAALAKQNTAPEDPLMKQLFGVTRGDLYDISRRTGNLPGTLPSDKPGFRGSEKTEKIMTPRNASRIKAAIEALRSGAPETYQGMHGWYVMDPLQEQLMKLHGREKGLEEFRRMNVFMGTESPGSNVMDEIERGTAANAAFTQGLWPEWQRAGKLGAGARGRLALPLHLRTAPGTTMGSTAERAQTRFIETGEHGMTSPKVPPYIEASGTPETGFQTRTPIIDSHSARSLGLSDVRGGSHEGKIKGSVQPAEAQQLVPWYRQNISDPLGIEAVPAQALQWAAFSPATGVSSPIGAPKLEVFSSQVGKAAKRLGVTPQEALERVLTGRDYAGAIDPQLLMGMGAVTGGGAAVAPAVKALLNSDTQGK